MSHDETEFTQGGGDADASPYRIEAGAWNELVADLGADKPARAPRGARRPREGAARAAGGEVFEQIGRRSAWEIALELAGRLGHELGEGKFAVLCINDAEHSAPPPDRTAAQASGSCVLLPPTRESIFGLPRCAHSHCKGLTLRQWIEAVGRENWEEAVVQARGWRRAREFLLHDGGISGWKRIPFSLRDGDDLVDGGPMQVVPDEDVEYCDFPARIVADIEEHEVSTSRRWYELEATVSGRARRFRVAATEFASLGWVAGQLGPEAVISPGRDTQQKLRAALQYLSKPVPRRDTFAFTGWRTIGGRAVYLHAGGGLSADGAVEGVCVSLAGDVLPRFALPAPPEGAALRDAVVAASELFDVAAPEIAIPLFAAVWRAPLGPSQLTLYLSAPAKTGKSMLAALAQQHFGAGLHEFALPASVKHSTAASVNALRALVGDAVFVLDDFLVSGNAVEDLKLSDKIDTVVRAQYGGTGAQRLSRDGSLSTAGTPPRSTLVITGETLPRGHSLRSRMLVLELPGPIEKDLAPQKRAAAEGVYARAMAGYLRWLAPRLDEIRAELRALVATTAEKLTSERDHRTGLLLAEVAVGVKYFLEFAESVGAMSREHVAGAKTLTWKTLQEMARAQRVHQVSQDPALRFCQLLDAALVSGRCHVTLPDGGAPPEAPTWGWRAAQSRAPVEDDELVDELPLPDAPEGAKAAPVSKVYRPNGPGVGLIDPKGSVVWVRAEVAHEVARQVGAGVGDPLPIALEDLGRRLHEKGLLASDELKSRRTYTVRRRVGGKVQGGYLALRLSALGREEDEARVSVSADGVSVRDTGLLE